VIVNDEQRRAMEFIATVNRGGYRPTGREINEWRLRSDPKPARKGRLLEPEVPEVPERRIRKGPTAFDIALGSFAKSHGAWNKQLSAIARQSLIALNSPAVRSAFDTSRMVERALGYEYDVVPGKPGKAAVYAPDKRPEKFLAHLRRLGWIERDSRGRYGVTLLGHALLKAEASADSGDEDSSVMVLAAEDELAYGQVLGVIAECGDALVMDGYLGAQELIHILAHTNASRFLIGDRLNKGRVTELALQINLAPPNQDGSVRELRRASFHDRFVLGEHKVYGLSASLNSIGKSMATLIEMPDTAARSIRADAEEHWSGGAVLARGLHPDDLIDVDGDAVAAGEVQEQPRIIRQEGGVFLHDGCNVRHRSQHAAQRCTKGP
jgi:hypothetical protein